MPTQILDLASTASIPQIDSRTPKGSSALGKDEFLKLLVAQLANQDPTNPQDSGAFVAQLAQFSALEQQQNAVGRLDTLLLGQATANQTAAATFIGKDVTFRGGDVHLVAGHSPSAELTLTTAAADVTVDIKDGSGATVRTLAIGPHDSGRFTVTWDGRDKFGNPVPDGTYSFSPSAADADKKAVAIAVSTSGTVSGVAYEGGIPLLKVGDAMIKMTDVTSINSPPASPPAASSTSVAAANQAYSQQSTP